MSLLLSLKRSMRSVPQFRRFIGTGTVISNLNRVKTAFNDKDGLFDKIGLITSSLNKDLIETETDVATIESPSNIRIGLIGSKSSLLNTILSDPFASNQDWFEEFKTRENKSSTLTKYSDNFQRIDNVWGIPSPFLNPNKRKGLEFLEIKDIDCNDGCHFYLSFEDNLLNDSIRNWSIYSWNDINSIDLKKLNLDEIDQINLPKLTINQINSEISEFAIELLRKSPKNSPIYTKLTEPSNILSFIKIIDNLIEKKDLINLNLFNSILNNIETQLIKNSLNLNELNEKNVQILKFINNWNELTHNEFQHKFKPFVNNYERKNLSWWKLYFKADEIKIILKKMFDTQLLNDSLKNYSYIKGQIDSFSSFPTSNQKFEFNKELKSLPIENSLTKIKNELIENDASDLQLKAIKLIAINLCSIQFPIVLLSILGNNLYNFSNYSMIGLGSLGLVIGFNRVSKNWVKLIEDWKSDIFEKIRLSINDENKELINDWEIVYLKEQEKLKEREDIIKSLKDIDDFKN